MTAVQTSFSFCLEKDDQKEKKCSLQSEFCSALIQKSGGQKIIGAPKVVYYFSFLVELVLTRPVSTLNVFQKVPIAAAPGLAFSVRGSTAAIGDWRAHIA